VDIISCSVCYWKDKDGNDITTNGYTAVTRWVDWAAKQGRVVCTAMGNDFNGNPPESSLWAPADNFNGISVGATKNDGSAITYYSRRGRTADKRLKPDVVAPGGDDTVSPGDIYNPDHYVNWVNLPCLNNNWTAACGWNEGTSFATPMVAGVIACMMEKTPALKGKPLQVRTRLWETAVDKGDAGPDTTYGFGLVDANSAADNAKPQLMIRDTANGVEWGRSTDVGFVPSCDINASVGYPTPNGIYDGFENGDDPFWTSPDIFVDNVPQNNQPDNPNEPIANQLNHFKVRVTNIGDGNAAADSYRVKLYKTDPNTGMTVWTLVDTQNTTPAINAGSTGLVDLTWQTPALNDLGQTHWCMGATVEHKTNADDKAPVPGQAPTGAIPAFNTVLCDNLAIRNFYVQPPASPVVINFRVQNTTEVFGPVMLTLVPVEMPSGWTCYLSQDIFTLAPGQEAIPPPSVTVNPPTSPPTGERAIIHVQARGPTGEVLGGFGLKVYKRGAIPTPGTLMLALGPATPADHLYPTIPPDSDNEMLQMRATSGGAPAEPVRIKSITLAASGTGDDLADISAVKLWVDNNHDGIVNVGDTLLATSTYSWDNGNVKLSPAAPGYLINAGAFVDLLISYVMSGGDPGETYSFSVADVDTFGGNSGSSVTLSGLPINSCTKTIRPIPTGTLTMNKGAYSPQNHWGFLWEDNIMLQMYLAANGWENINMHTITLQANGTGNDQTDIASVKIYKDADNDGVVDAGDPLLGSGAYLLGDNTQLIIPLVTTITKSTGINILVVYSMDGGGGAGGGGCTYWCTVDSIGATGALTLNEVTKVGLPIISSVKTLGWAGPGGSQTIGQWMKEKDGTKVHLSGVVVSLGYNVLTNNIIYVQESNRSNGVMVTSPVFGIGANEGDILDIDGVIETDPLTHERRIVQPVISKSGETDAPKPLGMNMSAVGGGMFGLYKFGRTGGGGLNNVGLLAKLWGRMVGGDLYTYWTLYDGGGDGIRVDLTGRREAISSVPAASYVTVKGVIVLRQDSYSGEWVPVLIPATNGGDVMWYMP
ncbi:MAG: S8 family serine peptidase, partial [Armatimonadetes bacterium]|nr:S8 family serine peptidase [Armatimonadota bacterium]